MKPQRKNVVEVPHTVTVGIDVHHPSGIGSVPKLYRQVRVRASLASELFRSGEFHWDVTNSQYGCWSDQWKPKWEMK